MRLKKKALFLDRDGVINKNFGYVFSTKNFIWLKHVKKAIKYAYTKKYLIIVITNQSGIARGYFKESDYQVLTQWMVNQFNKNNIDILDVFHCPHLPDSNCNCRNSTEAQYCFKNALISGIWVSTNLPMPQYAEIGGRPTPLLGSYKTFRQRP